MTRTIAFALFLCAIPLVCSGQRPIMVAPRQEFPIRLSLLDRQELKPLAAEYEQAITTLLQILKSEDQVTNVFGTKLETHRSLTPDALTNGVALPLFAPTAVILSGLLVT